MLEHALLFSLSANKKLTQDVADRLGIELGKVAVNHFSDGETICEPLDSVRDKNCYILQSTCSPVTENLFEILIFADALKRSSAKMINLIVPYFGYARQDRQYKPRQPITSKLVADLLATAGINRIISFDLHTPQLQGFFSCLVDELTAIPLIASYYKKEHLENVVVVSPDHGGVNRARRVAERLDTPLAIVDKRRPQPNISEVMNVVGDVKGKNCLIIDDMIDTAGSCWESAKALKEHGALSVRVACVHGIFSGPAKERLLDGTIDEILCTDSIPLRKDMNGKVKVISLAPMIAMTIDHIEGGIPLSSVYDIYNNDEQY